MPMKYVSLFSGIEAASVAWEPIGWEPLAFAEIEPFPSAVLAHRFPNVPNHGDVTAFNWGAYRGRCDLLVGGSPCQSFSVAGLRGSLSDARGNLALAYCLIVHDINPTVVVYENVPGILSTKDNAFGCFLAGLVGEGEPLVCGDGSWPDAGMVAGPRRSAAWRVLDAQYFKLAQRRRRVFVVSFRTGDGINPGAVLFEPESVRRDSPPRREAGTGVASSLTRSLGTGADDNKAQANRLIPSGPTHCSEVSRALTACHTATGWLDPNKMEFVAHSLRADGFDASEDGTGRGTPRVPVAFPTEFSNQGCGEDQSPSLYTRQMAVAYGIHSDALDRSGEGAAGNASERAGLGISEDLSPCINAKRPNAVAAPIAFQERGREGGRSVETQEDLAYSLTAPNGGGRRHELNVAAPVSFQTRFARNGRGAPEEVCPTLQGASAGATSDMRPCVSAGMAVRRLTPRECERLQGFPDDYTLIPYRGKAAADGNRYKALGNSMAVPVLRWLGERIEKVCRALPLDQRLRLLPEAFHTRNAQETDAQERALEGRDTHAS